jgi:transaldolase
VAVSTSATEQSPSFDRLGALADAGVSIWLDDLSRELLDSGELARLVDQCHVTGATSNPSIFRAALDGSERYDVQLKALSTAGVSDPRELFLALALDDVVRAAELFRPVFDRTAGGDGFVSFECTPDVAYDAEGTVLQALSLWERIDRPNALIKVPATEAGVVATEELLAAGVNVNVTLLFSRSRYGQILDAHRRGLQRRVDAGQPVSHVASVASFFVSRVDVKADTALPAGSRVRGRVGVANAASAYALFVQHIQSGAWQTLAVAGAQPQRPLWASTGTKNPAYSDVLYVESLIAPNVVNTMPAATLRAFADHGRVTSELDRAGPPSEVVLGRAATAGFDLDQAAHVLEAEGIDTFSGAYTELLDGIRSRVDRRESHKAH